MKRTITLLTLPIAIWMSVMSFTATAQDRQISGKVTSKDDSQTIPGVSVSVKGTTVGTVTDIDGNYKLTVPASAKTLVFSFVGMKTKEVELTASTTFDLVMETDVLKLDEVVVTAIGIKQEKKAIGYSSQNVGGDEITRAGQTNTLSGLSGKVAGLQVTSASGSPGSSVALRLRGATSITGNNNPLIIVDGVGLDNSHNASGLPDNAQNNFLENVNNSNRAIDINPDDIESINVLKGPSATALYGISASNGAIVITTKKGGQRAGGGVNVTYGFNYTSESVTHLPELQKTWVKGTGDAYRSYQSPSSGSWGPSVDTTYWDPSQTTPYNQNGQMIGAARADTTPGAIKLTPFDNVDQFFRTGTTLEHNIALSGGNDASSFRFSLSALNQDGIVALSDFDRYSAKIAGQSSLTSKLSASGSITYTKSGGRRVQQGSNLSGLMLDLLRTPVSFDNSNGSDDPEDQSAYILPDGTQRNYRGGAGYDNPYWTINQNQFNDDVNRMFGYAQADYKFADWISATYRLGTDFYSDRRNQFFAINSKAFPGGQVSQQDFFYRHLNSDLLFNLTHKFSNNLKGNLTVGMNHYNRRKQNMYTQGDNLNFPDFYNFSVASTILTRESTTRYRTLAQYAAAQLTFKDMLYLNLTGRNESSSTLPVDANTFFYPSASLGWIFTEMKGLNNMKFLPYGKLRLSYAQVGKDAPPYALSNTFEQAFAQDGWTSGIAFPIATIVGPDVELANIYNVVGYTANDYLGNPNLKPEKTSSIEIGTDLKFYQNRAGIDFTYYSSKSEDQILPARIAPSTGYQFQYVNIGSIENKGMEIIAYGKPIVMKNFEWEITINYAKNTNEVVALADGVDQIYLGGFESSAIYAVVGKPYGQIYGTRWLRDSNGNVVISDVHNVDPLSGFDSYGYPIQDAQVGVIGDPNPDWTGGIRNTFTLFKNITISALIDIKSGGDIWNGTRGALRFFGRSADTEDRGTATVFEGVGGHLDPNGVLVSNSNFASNSISVLRDQSYYQAIGGGFGGPTEQFVEDGSYTKLRELTVGYNFPAKLLKKTPFRTASLAFIARNLWIDTDYSGVDPETSLTGAENSLGMDYFNMPGTKSFGFSLKVGL